MAERVPRRGEGYGGDISVYSQRIKGYVGFIFPKDKVAVVGDAIIGFSIRQKKFLVQKIPPLVSTRRADVSSTTQWLPPWPHPLSGATLPGHGRLARALAPLKMLREGSVNHSALSRHVFFYGGPCSP